MNGHFYRVAFFMLLSYIAGNGTTYLVFGLHTAAKGDVDKLAQVQSAQYEEIETHLHAIDLSLADLTGQLRAKKLLDEEH